MASGKGGSYAKKFIISMFTLHFFSESIEYGEDRRYFIVGDLVLLLYTMDLPPGSNSEQNLYRASGSLKSYNYFHFTFFFIILTDFSPNYS